MRINQTLCLVLASIALMACHKDKEADSPDSVDVYSDDRDEPTQSTEDALEETEEDLEDAADEIEDEVDGDPTTD